MNVVLKCSRCHTGYFTIDSESPWSEWACVCGEVNPILRGGAVKTVKTLQLSAKLAAQGDDELKGLLNEAVGLLNYAGPNAAGMDKIVQFSVEVEHISGGSTKLQYARRDA